MPASPPTKSSDRTSSEAQAQTPDNESPKVSAEAHIEGPSTSAEPVAAPLEDSNETSNEAANDVATETNGNLSVEVSDGSSQDRSSLLRDCWVEGHGFYLLIEYMPEFNCFWVHEPIADTYDFTYPSDKEPDQSIANSPVESSDIAKKAVPAGQRSHRELYVPERWEFIQRGPRGPKRDPPRNRGSTVSSIPWSEADLARLWILAKHEDQLLKMMKYPVCQLDDYFEMPMSCRRCQGDLQDHNLKRRGELEVSQAGARRHAEELRKNNVKPAARPVVGEIRKYIYDKWNPDLLIGISTWEREDVEKEYSKGLNKYYKRFAKYGCWGHPGKMAGHGRVWTCCGRQTTAPGCTSYFEHETITDKTKRRDEWHLFEAPSGKKPKDFRHVVAISCETGRNVWGDEELIRLTAIDYYSGEVLIDNLVWPDIEMWHTHCPWNTSITWGRLEHAHRADKAIRGRNAARELLFNFVGDKTILIVHEGRKDLVALRMIHRHILDVKFLNKEDPVHIYEKKQMPSHQLKAMAKKFLRREIQENNLTKGSFENALACRDLAHHFLELKNLPDLYVPDCTGLGEDTTVEDACKLWDQSKETLRAMYFRDWNGQRPDVPKCDIKAGSSGLVPSLVKFRVYKSSPFCVVLKDLKGNSIDEDGRILQTLESLYPRLSGNYYPR